MKPDNHVIIVLYHHLQQIVKFHCLHLSLSAVLFTLWLSNFFFRVFFFVCLLLSCTTVRIASAHCTDVPAGGISATWMTCDASLLQYISIYIRHIIIEVLNNK